MSSLTHIDDQAFLAVNEFARDTPWLHDVAVGFAEYGVVLFGLCLIGGVVYSRRRDAATSAAAVWAGLGMLLALGLNQPIGNAVQEARPYVTFPHALLLTGTTTDFSFPSDHAVMAGAVAAGLLVVSRRLGLVAAALAVLLAVTRVYVGAHYPWDVLAGLAVGALVVWLGWLVVRVPLTSVVTWLRATRMHPLLVADSGSRSTTTLPQPARGS